MALFDHALAGSITEQARKAVREETAPILERLDAILEELRKLNESK